MKKRVIYLTFLFLTIAQTGNGQEAATDFCEFYVNDFESNVGPEWSATRKDITPIGQRSFIGQFGNETLSLSLADLPTHSLIRFSFDLYLLRSWDGSNTETFYGPDIWTIEQHNGPTLLRTTFSNHTSPSGSGLQNYPDSYPGPEHSGYTGAAETNSLGYWHPLGWYEQDSVYQLNFVFEHAETAILELDFHASGLQSLTDESWGLDNVRVSVDCGTDLTMTVPGLGRTGLVALVLLILSTGLFFRYRLRTLSKKNGKVR